MPRCPHHAVPSIVRCCLADTLAWTEVRVSPPVPARTGHTALCLPHRDEENDDGAPTPPRDEVLVFGGGDNEGHFFSDLISVSIPWHARPN